MRKNRYIPFGYCMEDGAVVPYEAESQTVSLIFELYIAGKSYLAIAQRLSSGSVPYHSHTSAWNKNMVKRILENPIYLGTEYPHMIESAIFEKAQSVIAQKSPKIKKKYVRKLKTEFVCGECGKSLDTKRLDQKELCCANPECRLYYNPVTEYELHEKRFDVDMARKQFAELKILQKAELSQTQPSEETLIDICEKIASLRFAEQSLKQPDLPQNESWHWDDLYAAKRVILYADHVQII